MKFDDSLTALVELARVHVDFGGRTVVIRDGAGRLIIAAEEIRQPQELEEKLRARLGGYIGPAPFAGEGFLDRLVSGPGMGRFQVRTSAGPITVAFADRRIIGMDWLQSPSLPKAGEKRMVFGSLKGGVGRSTALSVLAAELARRNVRVLVVDLDLEAPGVGTMLLPSSNDVSQNRRPMYGVMDYLVENGLDEIVDEELTEFVGVSPFHDGTIDVLPALGRRSDENPELVIAKLSRAVIEDVSSSGTISLTQQIDTMLRRFTQRGNYDVVLIDARAGMSEITAAPLLGLGADVLLFGTDQPQTFEGYSYILAHLVGHSSPEALHGVDTWRAHLHFVQSKAPASGQKRSLFRERLYEMCSAYLYDEEAAPLDLEVFSPGPSERGPWVPHDATHVEYNPGYDAFDPIGDRTLLDEEVYRGPFGAFLARALEILELDADNQS